MQQSNNNQQNEVTIRTDLSTDRFEIILPQGNQANPEALANIYAGTIPHEITSFVNMTIHAENYRRLGVATPKGFLLYGPPGTGKTTVARGIAQSLNLPFISAGGASFSTHYLSEGAENVRRLFRAAQNIRRTYNNINVIVFIDEIDSLARKRQSDTNSTDDANTLTELLRNMDGLNPNDGIIIIGATNRLEALDPAILRPGRFDRTIRVDMPNEAQRLAILNHHARTKVCDNNINFESLAQRTEGWNAAELSALLNEAGIRAGDARAESITADYVEQAFNYIVNQRAEKAREHERNDSKDNTLNADELINLLRNKKKRNNPIETKTSVDNEAEDENHEKFDIVDTETVKV